jgi:hypothetical protein
MHLFESMLIAVCDCVRCAVCCVRCAAFKCMQCAIVYGRAHGCVRRCGSSVRQGARQCAAVRLCARQCVAVQRCSNVRLSGSVHIFK